MHEENTAVLHAVLRSSKAPTGQQLQRFSDFLQSRYHQPVELTFEADEALTGGFILQAGDDTYDWSLEGRLRQFRERLEQLNPQSEKIIPLMKEAVENWAPEVLAQETGEVLTVGDEIATVRGLPHASYGEILLFSNGVKGMVQDLKRDEIGCILFGKDTEIVEGSRVTRTKKRAGVPVGNAFLGRVVNALGEPIDGLGPAKEEDWLPVEAEAPGIVDRKSVSEPMETGILAIDSMFPIGRGQRELIIGDRQTGKTSIAVDTMLNQKGKGVICIYVAIGQKASTIAKLVNTLKTHDAMDYTIVMASTASDPAPLQYIAPYAGTAMAEFFMRQGRDVLIRL